MESGPWICRRESKSGASGWNKRSRERRCGATAIDARHCVGNVEFKSSTYLRKH